MRNPVESLVMTFLMSIGDLEDVWNAFDYTKHTRKKNNAREIN